MSVFHGSFILQYLLFYLLSLTEITLDQTKNELEKIKQEKIDLETKLQLFKSSDVSILTTAKNRMEKKYHEKDLELAKAIAKIEKLETSKIQPEENGKNKVINY